MSVQRNRLLECDASELLAEKVLNKENVITQKPKEIGFHQNNKTECQQPDPAGHSEGERPSLWASNRYGWLHRQTDDETRPTIWIPRTLKIWMLLRICRHRWSNTSLVAACDCAPTIGVSSTHSPI
jgi:hypothetical protein